LSFNRLKAAKRVTLIRKYGECDRDIFYSPYVFLMGITKLFY